MVLSGLGEMTLQSHSFESSIPVPESVLELAIDVEKYKMWQEWNMWKNVASRPKMWQMPHKCGKRVTLSGTSRKHVFR
jgi:hypothetical protein